MLLAGTPAGTRVVTCVYLQLDQHICPSLHQHDYLWSCNQSTNETRARIAGVHGAEHRWVRGRGEERGEERHREKERESERKGLGEGRHTTSFTTTHTGRAMRNNLWLSLVSSK